MTLAYPIIQSLVIKRLGRLVDVDDVTQECILGIHKNLATYHPAKPIMPWISAIIRYKVADHFRRLSQRKEQALTDEVTNLRAETKVSIGESTPDVVELLGSLPEKLKRALWLTQVEGLSYQKAAENQGISEVALRKRISRAYDEIRRKISKAEEFGELNGQE